MAISFTTLGASYSPDSWGPNASPNGCRSFNPQVPIPTDVPSLPYFDRFPRGQSVCHSPCTHLAGPGSWWWPGLAPVCAPKVLGRPVRFITDRPRVAGCKVEHLDFPTAWITGGGGGFWVMPRRGRGPSWCGLGLLEQG